MQRDELIKELSMSYSDLIRYLIAKYGEAEGDYFCTPDCRSKNKKISRTAEGLYCHHIDEDKGGNLSDCDSARKQPYEWQKRERLVYCNMLEHLILHIKIAILRQKKKLYNPIEIGDFFSTGGIYMVCSEINDIFNQKGTTILWKQCCYKEVEENYNDYIFILKVLLAYIKEQYLGEKTGNVFLKVGTKFEFAGEKAEITGIDSAYKRISFRKESGVDKSYRSELLRNYFTYADEIKLVIRRLSTTYDEFLECIYQDISKDVKSQEVTELSHALSVDFHGYGFSQFTEVLLDKTQYGSFNVDEYISKAFPTYSELDMPIIQENPEFWIGEIPEELEKKNSINYVVRIKVAFDIKPGRQPFVRYKEKDLLRVGMQMELTNDNNLLHKQGVVLSTSNIYDHNTGEYYSRIREKDGKVVEASVILTFVRKDFELFKEMHRIREIQILDGCYFSR